MRYKIVMISISGLLGIQIFISVGKERLTLVSVIAGAVVNFTLNMILIPLQGAVGAAVATVVAECTVTAVQLVAGREYFHGGKNLVHAAKVCISSECPTIICPPVSNDTNLQFGNLLSAFTVSS